VKIWKNLGLKYRWENLKSTKILRFSRFFYHNQQEGQILKLFSFPQFPREPDKGTRTMKTSLFKEKSFSKKTKSCSLFLLSEKQSKNLERKKKKIKAYNNNNINKKKRKKKAQLPISILIFSAPKQRKPIKFNLTKIELK
jgi:hypothetical protein